MKCIELKNKLDTFCNLGHAEDDIVIILSEKSIGAHANSEIESVQSGFDWDRGKILIRPAKKTCFRNENKRYSCSKSFLGRRITLSSL